MHDSGRDLRVQLFGGPRLWKGDEEIPLSPFQACLLAVVATESSRSVTRERLAWLLWETEDDAKARHRISQLIYAINRKVGETLLGGDKDVVRVEVKLASDIAGSGNIAGKPLDQLWGREPTGAFEQWSTTRSETLRREAISARVGRMEEAQESGNKEAILLQARSILSIDPMNEPCLRTLLQSLATARSPLQALAAFDLQRQRILQWDKEWTPSSETLTLVKQLRVLLERGETSSNNDSPSLPFVGRDEELKLLEGWCSTTQPGWHVALLSGEAGIGKSRLLGELERLLRLKGHTVLFARSYEGSERVPFELIAELLKREPLDDLLERAPMTIHAVLEGALSSTANRIPWADWDVQKLSWLTMDSLRHLFEQLDRPIIILIDDIQHTDASSIAALLHLYQRATAISTHIVATSRSEPFEPNGAGALFGRDTLRVDLPPLSTAAVELLFGEADPLRPSAEEIGRLSGGNPLFAVEIAHSLRRGGQATEIPASLEALLKIRTRQLSPTAATVLNFLSIQGRPASLHWLSELTGFESGKIVSAITEAEGLRLLRVGERNVAFRHGVMSHWICNSLSRAEYRLIHRTTAVTLRKSITDPTSSSDVAWHYSEAGEKEEAFAWAMRSAKSAREQGAFHDVIRSLRIAKANATSEGARVTILEELSTLLLQQGELEEAILHLTESITIQEEKGPPAFSLRMSNILATVQAGKIGVEEGARELNGIYKAASEDHDWAVALRALDFRLIILTAAVKTAEAARAFDTFTRLSIAGDATIRCRGHLIRCFALCYGEPKVALTAAEDAVALAKAHDMSHLLPTALARLAIVLIWQARLDDQEINRLLDEAKESYSASGDLKGLCNAYVNGATWWIDTYQSELAERYLRRAKEFVEKLRDHRLASAYHVNLAQLRLQIGDIGGAETHFRVVEEKMPAMYEDMLQIANAGLGICALHRGQLAEARMRAARSRIEISSGSLTFDPTLPIELQVRQLRARGRGQEAIELLDASRSAVWNRHKPAWLRLTLLECKLRSLLGQAGVDALKVTGLAECDRLRLGTMAAKFRAVT